MFSPSLENVCLSRDILIKLIVIPCFIFLFYSININYHVVYVLLQNHSFMVKENQISNLNYEKDQTKLNCAIRLREDYKKIITVYLKINP